MPNLKFFNDTPNIKRFIFGGICLTFCYWIIVGLFEKQQLDPLVKTIGLSIALWATLFSLYSTLQVKSFFINDKEQFIGHTKGITFLNKTHIYPYSEIKSIELRSVYVKHHDSDISDEIRGNSTRTFTKKYYCVLIFKDDELYMEGSSDENETMTHVREIAKYIGKPFKVNFNGKNRTRISVASATPLNYATKHIAS
jgi:hypothetical protein